VRRGRDPRVNVRNKCRFAPISCHFCAVDLTWYAALTKATFEARDMMCFKLDSVYKRNVGVKVSPTNKSHVASLRNYQTLSNRYMIIFD